MAKKDTYKEVDQHYQMWTEDNERHLHRKNGWNDVTDAYYGVLPHDWPYITKIVDPVIRTSILEKNARLLNSKLRGRLIPRESGDILAARLNNSVLDFQWDNANEGGSMLTKLSISDMDSRLYGSKFALVVWRYEENSDGEVIFDGNEMIPLDIRDCGIDPTATHIRDAKWFQLRTWEFLDDLETQTDAKGNPKFKNLKEIRRRIDEKLPKHSSKKKDEYVSRVKQIRGLEDRTGEDIAFPVIQLVTEYREDKWITFAPEHDLILREIDNPYDHGKIPVAQLRYYPLQDDPLGESEVEPVIPLWKAIQATVCGYLDEVTLKMRPPLKIVENAARIETIQYGPEAQWLVDDQDAIQEMRSSGDSLGFFQTTYTALKSAFNVAMGDLSQGTSGIDPTEPEKTATEIRATVQQRNARDQKNQTELAQYIKDIMMMWLSNNKQFLFSDPDQVEYIVRIVGTEQFNYFKRAGLDDMTVSPETLSMIGDIVEQEPNMSDFQLEQMIEAGLEPRFPVVENPGEKDIEKLRIKPKMKISDLKDSAEVSIVPKDLEGTYDYIPDVKSMSLGSGEELAQARQQAIQLFTANPTVLQLMQQEGYRPNVKELLRSTLEELGLRDADRFFTKIENEPKAAAQANGGLAPNSQIGGLPGAPQAAPQGGVPEQVGGAVGLQAPPTVS